MKHIFPIAALAALFLVASGVCRAAPRYSPDVTTWTEDAPPPETQKQDREDWLRSANAAFFEWNVSMRTGRPTATLDDDETGRTFIKPTFPTASGKFNSGTVFAQVTDGWLVGMREERAGETGDAELHWFSRDGKKSYKISDHRVTDFIPFAGALHAIEGRRKEDGAAEGSLIRLARPKPGAAWEATEVVKLPGLPYTVCADKKGSLVITLDDGLVSVGQDRVVHQLLTDAPWNRRLYPNSSVLRPDGWRLYIGMRRYVAEYDLKEKKLRFLTPYADFAEKWMIEMNEGDGAPRRRGRDR